MTHHPAPERHLPGRLQALVFHLKTRVLQLRRGIREISTRPPRHPAANRQADAPVIAEARALLPAEPWDTTTWKAWTDAVKTATGRKGKPLFMPLRLALTGLDHGPELAQLLPLIGRERALERLT
jgi:glutamyl/glutaminyl-tRNA synthetase